MQHLADKHKLLVKDDIGILVKSLTEICDNRISSFAADFNTLYMSKIAEADRPGPSAANVQAARVSDVSPAPSTSNAHFNSGISGRYNVTPAASVSRSGNFYEPNYDQDVGNSSVPSHSACVEPQSTAPTNVVHPICSLIALPTHANNVDDVPSPSISNVGNSDDCNGLGMFDDSINANINEVSSQPPVASVPEFYVSEGGVIRGVSFECVVPTKFHEKSVDVVLDSKKPLVSHGNVDSMNCDIDSLQDKIELLLNTGVATIQQSSQFYYIVVFFTCSFQN